MVEYGGNLPGADFSSHHIEGYARAAEEAGKNGYFNAPLISHIEGNLWVGGCIGRVQLPEDFKNVVSLYKWEKYKLGPDTHRLEIEMYDAGYMPDIAQLHEIADKVNEYLAEGKTLVHCQAGLNRSNLVSALALIKQGRKPEEVIALLREKRSSVVLCNEVFEKWLLEQGETVD
jgi:protein-tyrosine phosphatase